MNMKNVLVHGELNSEIYMNQPNRFENEVWIISPYMQNAKKPHLDANGQILRYDKGCHDPTFETSKDRIVTKKTK